MSHYFPLVKGTAGGDIEKSWRSLRSWRKDTPTPPRISKGGLCSDGTNWDPLLSEYLGQGPKLSENRYGHAPPSLWDACVKGTQIAATPRVSQQVPGRHEFTSKQSCNCAGP